MPTGYLTGRDLIALSDEALQGYLIGFVNGAILSVVMGATTQCVEQAHQCIARRPTDELAKAVRVYIADNAARLRDDAATFTFNVLFGACVTELSQPSRSST